MQLPGSPHDFVRADPIGGQQHDLSPPDMLLRHVAVLNQGLEPTLPDQPHHAAISYVTMFMEFIIQSEIIANSGRSR
jgi:hypothetical protein